MVVPGLARDIAYPNLRRAGGGVVADSDPETEYQEACSKARALVCAAEEMIRLAAKRDPHRK